MNAYAIIIKSKNVPSSFLDTNSFIKGALEKSLFSDEHKTILIISSGMKNALSIAHDSIEEGEYVDGITRVNFPVYVERTNTKKKIGDGR